MRDTIDDDTLVRCAEQALTRPDDFGYYGRHDLFWGWGLTPVSQTRDSGALEQSNYRRILEDMMKLNNDLIEFAGDFRASHWLTGWQDHIVVRVLYDPDDDITPENITGAFRMITEIARHLSEECPVYDESDFSELESDEAWAAFGQAWDSVKRGWDEDDSGPEPTEDEKDLTWRSLEIYDGDDVDEDKIREFLDDKRLEDAIAQYGDVPRTGTVIPGQMAFWKHPLEES